MSIRVRTQLLLSSLLKMPFLEESFTGSPMGRALALT